MPQGKNDFVLTSSRDEAPNRLPLEPDFYKENSVNMLYPRDKVAGGTWIGVSDKNRLICLLNGGYECHTKKEKYKTSRGVVVKDLLAVNDIEKIVYDYNLDDIEPFTIVIADWNESLRFFELVWDGTKRHITTLPLEPKIWSSATLYSSQMKAERLAWFDAYTSNNELKASSILNFHKTAGAENKNYGIIMDRGEVKTTSITQVEKTSNTITMTYHSLDNDQTAVKQMKTLLATVNE